MGPSEVVDLAMPAVTAALLVGVTAFAGSRSAGPENVMSWPMVEVCALVAQLASTGYWQWGQPLHGSALDALERGRGMLLDPPRRHREHCLVLSFSVGEMLRSPSHAWIPED